MIKRRPDGLLVIIAAIVFAPSPSWAGLGRPNMFSPLSIGIGGSGFAGVANPTTIYYNPAGMLLTRETVALGGIEMMTVLHEYQPAQGAAEKSLGTLLMVPAIGVSTRFAGPKTSHPLPVAFGVALCNSFGASLVWDEDQVQPGIIDLYDAMLEVVPAFSYQINSRLAVGFGLRFGMGTFNLVNTEMSEDKSPIHASGAGVAVGVNLGTTFQAFEWLRVGAVYASPMTVEMEGSGEVEVGTDDWRPDNVTLKVPWPQWAALGFAFRLGPTFELYSAVRWTDWSSFQELKLSLHAVKDVISILDCSDGISTHLGGEWTVGERFIIRGGLSYDVNVIPDNNLVRPYYDQNKLTLALGGSIALGRSWSIDVAYELLTSLAGRDVPDVTREEVDPVTSETTTTHVNPSPGKYFFTIHTVAFGMQYRY